MRNRAPKEGHRTRLGHLLVASAVALLVGPGARFEASGVSMSFSEPSVTFVNTVWQATELGFGGGEVSSFKNDKSRLRATAGDIEIYAGGGSTIEL